MKRYFNNMKENQVIMIEFDGNSIIKTMDICEVFGDAEDIVEISKSEYLNRKYEYKKLNETNLTMTISR